MCQEFWRAASQLIYIMCMRKAVFGTRDSGHGRRIRAKLLLLTAHCLLLTLFSSDARAQKVVDRMVATVNGGARVDLITYSDLLWQIALEPETPLENPSSTELNRVLNLLINQRLILQEAEKLPTVAPTAEEVRKEIDTLIRLFPSPAEFQRRLRRVGFSSKDDEQFQRIIEQRVAMQKYLDFRFRDFVVVTPQEVADYYRDVYVPRFRQQAPGRIVPTLEEVRQTLETSLTQSKIAADIDEFIESARERAEITILSPV